MKYTFINFKKQLVLLFMVAGALVFGQAPALEMATGASNPTGNGPLITTAINFQNNTNNPSGNTLATHTPTLTVTYTILDSQFPSSVNNSVINIGHNTGGAAPIFDLMNSQGSPSNANFTSAGASAGAGIDIGFNRAVRMFIMTYPLRVANLAPNGTHRMADIRVNFNRPVNNPVLHLGALGGTSATLGFGGRFELIASTGTLSATPLTRLSGNETAGFTVTGNAIFNNATTIAGSGAGSGSGSVMINGTNLTSLTFRVYIRGDGRAGSTSASWASSNTDTTTGESFTMGFSTLESDIQLTKTMSNQAAPVGGTVSFVVTATNNGPSNNTNIVIADALPSGYTIGTPINASVGSYSSGVWTIPSLNAGASATLTIPATVNASGNYTNVATITSAALTDQNSANNTASVSRFADSDSDGVFDYLDLDSDNDGILDTVECPPTNIVTNGTFTTNLNGWTVGPNWTHSPTIGAYNEGDFMTGGSSLSQSLTGLNGVKGGIVALNLQIGAQDAGQAANNTASLEIILNNTVYATLTNGTLRNNSNVTIAMANGATSTFTVFGTSGVSGYTQQTFTIYIPYNGPNAATLSFRMVSGGDDWSVDNVSINAFPCDTDGDTIPNYLDLDSDGDGCFDAIEGDENVLPAHLDANGRIRTNATGTPNGNNIASVNANGVPQLVNSGGFADIGATVGQGFGDSQSNAINTQCVDTDSDGIPDNIDLDDDNDGIPDAVECGENNRVVRGDFTKLPPTPGFMTAAQFATATGNNWNFVTTGTGISAQILWDNITDGITFGNGIRFQRDGQTQSITQNISGWNRSGTPQILISKFAANNSNPNGIASTLTLSYAGVEYVRIVTTNGLGTVATLTYSNGASGSVSSMAVGTIYNNWMIYLPSNVPVSGALRFDYFAGAADSDDFSIGDVIINACKDTDVDGIPDYLDLDSDGDGCFDAIEGDESVVASQLSGGRINIAANGGVGTTIGTNIGVPNLVNSGGAADSGGDVGQGIGQSQNVIRNDCIDSDADGVPDWFDQDDDNDGILDIVECPNSYLVRPVVTSSITTINTITSGNIQTIADAEGAGGTGFGPNPYWFTNAATNLPVAINMNMQAVSTMDHIKLYSPWGVDEWVKDLKIEFYNNANVLLGTEYLTAPNQYPGTEGTILSFSKEYTNVNRVIFTIITDQGYSTANPRRVSLTELVFLDLQICDTDGDGVPNILDLDSDGDGCADAYEGAANIATNQLVTAGGTLSGGGTTVNQNLCATGACVNANGIPQFSTLPAGYGNTTGQPVGNSQAFSRNDCVDSDGDGIPDVQDLDDDNDGILDTVECPPLYADYTSAVITGAAAATGTITNIQFGSATGNLTRVHNGTTSAPGFQLIPQNFSNPSIFTPAGSATQTIISEGITSFNNTSNFTRYTLTLDQPVESITLQIANWDYMRTRFVGNQIEQIVSGGTQLVYNPVTRQLYDSDPATTSTSVETRDGYGSIRITSLNGAPITQIVFDRIDDPATNSITDGFYYTFSVEPICDADGDGIPNRLDLDTDGDGCPDAIEGAANIATSQLVTAGGTLSGQNLCATGTCVNVNGIPQFSTLPTGYSNTTGQAVGNSNDGTRNDCLDSDGDGIADWEDVDDDNDGILDTNECSLDLSTYVANNFTSVVPAIPGSTADNTKFLQLRPSDFGLTTAGATNQNASHDYSTFFGLPAGSIIVTVENAHVHPNATSNPAANVFYTSARSGTGSTKITVSGTLGAYVAIEHGQEYYGLHERGIQFLDGSHLTPSNLFNLNTQTTTGNWQSGNNGNYYFVRHITAGTQNAIFGYGLINAQYNPKRVSISTNNIVPTEYSTYFIRIFPECDTDKDGVPNRLDLDSDADGCSDALEGGANFLRTQLVTAGGTLTGGSTSVNQNLCAGNACVSTGGANIGLPQFTTPPTGYTNATGQTAGNSYNSTVNGCFCTQNPTGGTPDGFTVVGVSTHETQVANWPANIGNGFIALDSQTKGLVITRVEHVGGTNGTPLPTDAISQPVEGMMVYDIQDTCVKLFDGTVWNCIQRGCNFPVVN